jgi:hypothetical protein
MKLRFVIFNIAAFMLIAVAFNSCQKMDRPELGEIILDPEPPPYEPLKSFFRFNGNLTDEGENDLTATETKNIEYVTGVDGQAVKFGDQGYILLPVVGDTVRHPNEFVGLPADTIINLGSYTISFWVNVPGPVTGGAQGIFSITNKNQFWGNLDIFFENLDNGDEAFIKVHSFNYSGSGNGESWTEVKIPDFLSKWSHFAVTYDAATGMQTLYGNGQKVLEKAMGTAYGPITFIDFNGIVIGNHQFQTVPTRSNHGPEDWAKALNGALDNLRIYNKALTEAEINSLYTNKQ